MACDQSVTCEPLSRLVCWRCPAKGDQPRINAFQRPSQTGKSVLPVMSQTKSSTTSKTIAKPPYKHAATKRSPTKDKIHGVRRAMDRSVLRSALPFVGRAAKAQSGDPTKPSMSCRYNPQLDQV